MADLIVPDIAMLRDPNLLVPGKKPIGPVEIDRAHPLGAKCSMAHLFGGANKANLADGKHPIYYGTSTYEADYLASTSTTGDDVYLDFDGEDPENNIQSIVVVAQIIVTGGASADGIYKGNDEIGRGWGFEIGERATNELSFYVAVVSTPGVDSPESYSVLTTTGYVVGSIPTLVGKWSPNDSVKLWVNGIYCGSTLVPRNYIRTCQSTGGRGKGWVIGRQAGGVSTECKAKSFFVLDGTGVTDEQCADLSRDPYQFLKPAGT